MKVKTDFTGCNYITAGKEYEAFPYNGSNILYNICNDVGDCIIIRPFSCAHLNRQGWQIVEENTND